MTNRRPEFHTASNAQKKRSLFASNEDNYSLSLKALPSAINMLNSKQQREIKNALREIDDLLYTLIYSQNEQAQADYQTSNNPPEPPPTTEAQLQTEARPAKGKLSK